MIKRSAWSCGLAFLGLAVAMFMGLDMLILSKIRALPVPWLLFLWNSLT
jgi:hypothetical protein